MTNAQLFAKTSKKLEALKNKAFTMSSRDAAKIETGLKGDGPVKVVCYDRVDRWKSRYLAYHFFKFGAICCDGCESERYWSIVTDLEFGREIASDDERYRRIA